MFYVLFFIFLAGAGLYRKEVRQVD